MTSYGAIPRGGYKQQPKRVPRSLGFAKYALRFDGVDDYVEVSRDASLEPQEFTLEAWVYLTQIDVYNIIFAKDYTSHVSPYYSYHLRTYSDGMEFLWNDGTTYRGIVYSGGALPTNEWMHTVATYKLGAQAIYKNGDVLVSGTRSDTITYFDTSLLIGKARNFDAWMHGLIDGVRIYKDYALDLDEIRWNGLNYHNPVRPDKLALWLPMEEGSGETVYDESGYGNHGTLLPAGAGPTWERVRQYELRAATE
jgi:hypothetical protein